MKHSELRHQPRHVNPRIQGVTADSFSLFNVTYAEKYTLHHLLSQINFL